MMLWCSKSTDEGSCTLSFECGLPENDNTYLSSLLVSAAAPFQNSSDHHHHPRGSAASPASASPSSSLSYFFGPSESDIMDPHRHYSNRKPLNAGCFQQKFLLEGAAAAEKKDDTTDPDLWEFAKKRAQRMLLSHDEDMSGFDDTTTNNNNNNNDNELQLAAAKQDTAEFLASKPVSLSSFAAHDNEEDDDEENSLTDHRWTPALSISSGSGTDDALYGFSSDDEEYHGIGDEEHHYHLYNDNDDIDRSTVFVQATTQTVPGNNVISQHEQEQEQQHPNEDSFVLLQEDGRHYHYGRASISCIPAAAAMPTFLRSEANTKYVHHRRRQPSRLRVSETKLLTCLSSTSRQNHNSSFHSLPSVLPSITERSAPKSTSSSGSLRSNPSSDSLSGVLSVD